MADKEPLYWFRTKSGKAIPVFEGETKEQALKKRLKANASKSNDTKTMSDKEFNSLVKERDKLQDNLIYSDDVEADKKRIAEIKAKLKDEIALRRAEGNYKMTQRGGATREEMKKAEDNLKTTPKDMKVVKDSLTLKFYGEINKKDFATAIADLKEKQPKEIRWRVDAHSAKDYKGCKCYRNERGVYAIRENGDIISVCTDRDNLEHRKGSKLLAEAVKNGGKKLDTYEGNYGFYVKCGFEPVSWCKFKEEHAPEGWKGNGNPEDIIFFKYTGKITNESLTDFKARVKISKDYDEAEEARDREL